MIEMLPASIIGLLGQYGDFLYVSRCQLSTYALSKFLRIDHDDLATPSGYNERVSRNRSNPPLSF
jgi:hypothetical protein